MRGSGGLADNLSQAVRASRFSFVNTFRASLVVQGASSMTTAANPSPVKVSPSARSAMTVGETLLHMVLSAAIPVSAVLFVVLTL
ncbi:hypothetical protein EIB18_15020 [Caulobacter vibrioides]|nr:hypothetical protein CA608_14970 [Caulobacter vibrioides]AZH13883.1 hypothetical protein EIB18_15020 [Caulobacter vibrioides]PLR07635.1 hypothetical protein CVUC_18920 [Caulobacter vibrioides]